MKLKPIHYTKMHYVVGGKPLNIERSSIHCGLTALCSGVGCAIKHPTVIGLSSAQTHNAGVYLSGCLLVLHILLQSLAGQLQKGEVTPCLLHRLI